MKWNLRPSWGSHRQRYKALGSYLAPRRGGPSGCQIWVHTGCGWETCGPRLCCLFDKGENLPQAGKHKWWIPSYLRALSLFVNTSFSRPYHLLSRVQVLEAGSLSSPLPPLTRNLSLQSCLLPTPYPLQDTFQPLRMLRQRLEFHLSVFYFTPW